MRKSVKVDCITLPGEHSSFYLAFVFALRNQSINLCLQCNGNIMRSKKDVREKRVSVHRKCNLSTLKASS